jgi:hypothetical protein
MRLVLAHESDVAARALAARWGRDAVLLTPAELSAERLLLRVDERGHARAEVPSRPEVTSVLTRLGGIGAADLTHVHTDDATYAAAELDAFLRAWLGAWLGPVVNRPSTTCLNGPGWRPEQWIAAAAAAGLRVCPVTRQAKLTGASAGDLSQVSSAARVTVVGSCWFGPVCDGLGRRLCALAADVGCSTLEVMLLNDVIVQISAWPNVAVPEVAQALAGLLDGTR